MSLPPEVRWEYAFAPEPGTPEAESLAAICAKRDWATGHLCAERETLYRPRGWLRGRDRWPARPSALARVGGFSDGAGAAHLQHVAEAGDVQRQLAEQHVEHRLADAADLAQARDALDDEVGVGLARRRAPAASAAARADASARLTTSTAAPISRRSRSLSTPEIIFQKSVSAW